MSIAGDLLTSATPARLLCRRGTWVLELVRLVPVERNVFQPRVQRLEGAEAVLQHLKRNGDNPALAAAASQLMRGPRLEDERAFDAVDGDWVPGELGSRRDSGRSSAPPPGGSSAGEVAELRAELLVLRASHERLRERVQRLESALHSPGRSHDVLSVPPTPSFVMPKASEAAPLAARPDSPSTPAPTATRTATAADVAPSGLSLPTVDAINASLIALIGESAKVTERRPVTFAPSEHDPCWVSRLIDDEGLEVGAIMADCGAAATFGGRLMSLSEQDIAVQIMEGAPSEDAIGAMSEVASNLCQAINQQRGGPQVRVKPIEKFVPGSLDWLATEAGRGMQLEVAGGLGQLFLFTR